MIAIIERVIAIQYGELTIYMSCDIVVKCKLLAWIPIPLPGDDDIISISVSGECSK